MEMYCVKNAENEGMPKTAATGSGRKHASCAKASQVNEVPSVAREAAKNLQDEWGDHEPAPQRVLVLRLLERKWQAYDGEKQARLCVCEG
eukprot:6203738-Pleurochrysis_carterae.AAC.2